MECKGINERLSAYIDKELSAEERLIVEQHIKDCSDCSLVLKELQQTVAGTKGLAEIDPPGWLEQKVMAKVREEAVQKQGFLNRLFDPLRTKIPVQVVATLAVVITAFLVFRYIEPEVAKVPVETLEEMESQDDALMQPEGETDAVRETLKEQSEQKAEVPVQEKTGRISRRMYKDNKVTIPGTKEERKGHVAPPSIPVSPEPGKSAEEVVVASPKKKSAPEVARIKPTAKAGAPELLKDEAPLLHKSDKDKTGTPRMKFVLSYREGQVEKEKTRDSNLRGVTPGVMLEQKSKTVMEPQAMFTGYIAPQLSRSHDGTGYVYSVTIDVVDYVYHVSDSVSQAVRNELDKERDGFKRKLHTWKYILSDGEAKKLRQGNILSVPVREPRSVLRRFTGDELVVTVKWKEEWD